MNGEEDVFAGRGQAARSKRMVIPTRDECLELMIRYGMLENIVHHSLEVTRVALYLSRELNRKGQRIDLGLVEAASLLHDLAKTECFKTKEDHAQAGSRLLKGLGYDKVGDVVGQHVWLSKQGDPVSVSEEELVNYADKRVRHDEIVSLAERFRDLKDRYGRDRPAIDYLERMEKAIFEVENKIFLILDMNPNDLQQLQPGVKAEGSADDESWGTFDPETGAG
jgi:uncharacterized protein